MVWPGSGSWATYASNPEELEPPYQAISSVSMHVCCTIFFFENLMLH